MRRVASILVVVPLALLAVLWPAGSSGAGSSGAGPNAQGASPLAPQAGAPTVVSYQGQVTVGGLPYTGDGAFKFAVVDASGATNYWANDGTAGGAPGAAVTLPVTGGLFSVLLGEGMTALPASAFEGPDRYLRVWFSGDGAAFTQLAPDRRIAAVPYALQAVAAGNAETLDGAQASAYQLRVNGVCEGGSTISAINADGTVICAGLPPEPPVHAGSVAFTSPELEFALVSFSLEAAHLCVPNQSCPPATYHLTLVHRLESSSPRLFEAMAKGEVLEGFTLFVHQPGRLLAYLQLDAEEVMETSIVTERGPGVGPLETITLSLESPDDPMWTTAGGSMPVPGDFPGQEQVGTLTLDTTASVPVTVPVYGHEWSASAGGTSPSFDSLIVTALLDGSALQIQDWLDTAAIRPSAQLELFTPGTMEVMATYQLGDFSIIGAEQRASGVSGEPAFNKITLNYARIRETIGTDTFCWDLATQSECS